MSTPTLTNIPSKLDIRVKEPSGVDPPSGVGPGSSQTVSVLYWAMEKLFWK